MGLLDRFRRQPRRETKAVLGLSPELGSFLIFGEGSAASPSSAFSLYEQCTAVSIPINMVAEAFSVIDPVLMMGDKVVKDHPALSIIKRPSPFYSQELFLDVLAKNWLIAGELAVVALGNKDRPPLEVQPVSPKSMTPVRGAFGSDAPASWHVSGNTLYGIYQLEVEDQRARYLDGGMRELRVERMFSTRDNSLLRGQSPMLSASREARSHVLGTSHNVKLLENGGRVSLIFNFEEDMYEDDFNKVKDRVVAQYSGPDNAGKIVVTAGGKLDVKEAGITPKDMDFGTLQSIAQQSCCLVYHVPLPLITPDRQTLDNYREGKLALYDDAVIPLSRRVLGALSELILPRFGLDPTQARFAMNPEDVTALVSRRNDELKKRADINAETVNEKRAMLGREPIEGGDVLLVPAAMVPLGTDLFTADNDVATLESEDGSAGTALAE